MRAEAPLWAKTLPQLPRLVHRALHDDAPARLERAILRLEATQRRQTRVLTGVVAMLALIVLLYTGLVLFWQP
jgi:ubiquinone biosynthesis protein